ncbi:putative HIT-like protein [Spirochaetota bacterium]|nr:putative HIT-like protein [Spirochaetota bacterium]
MGTIFTKIIKREVPAYIVAEDDKNIAFLDIRPLQKGHVLVIPKVEVDYYFDLADTTIAEMMVFAKKVARALKLAVPCTRIGVAVVGLEVPHAHIHLVPLNHENDISFSNPRRSFSDDELAALATQIKDQIATTS